MHSAGNPYEPVGGNRTDAQILVSMLYPDSSRELRRRSYWEKLMQCVTLGIVYGYDTFEIFPSSIGSAEAEREAGFIHWWGREEFAGRSEGSPKEWLAMRYDTERRSRKNTILNIHPFTDLRGAQGLDAALAEYRTYVFGIPTESVQHLDLGSNRALYVGRERFETLDKILKSHELLDVLLKGEGYAALLNAVQEQITLLPKREAKKIRKLVGL